MCTSRMDGNREVLSAVLTGPISVKGCFSASSTTANFSSERCYFLLLEYTLSGTLLQGFV